MSNIIVTRHAPLVQWLKNHGIEGEVIAQATPETVHGKGVYGILPMWLAAYANSVTEVSMPELPLEARSKVNGGDFTVEQMDSWGAHQKEFVVIDDPEFIAALKRFGKKSVLEYVKTMSEA